MRNTCLLNLANLISAAAAFQKYIEDYDDTSRLMMICMSG